jgi:hypothetical protein
MLSAVPDDVGIIGLTSIHPMATEVARRGHRWYRTPGNIVGWAYCLRRDTLGKFLSDRVKLGASFQAHNEDDQIGLWSNHTKQGAWHPVPAICDHDTSVPSSYNNDAHSLRRPQVTWRDFGEGSLCDPQWWKPSGLPEMLSMPPQHMCWFCMERPIAAKSGKTGAGICPACLASCVSNILNGQLK